MSLLQVSRGAASIKLENLANAKFSKMRLTGGTGCALDFGGELSRDAEVAIESALSRVEIAVPASTAARIVAEPNLGSTVDVGDGLTKREGVFWTEAGMAGNEPLLTIRASVTQGALQIRAT